MKTSDTVSFLFTALAEAQGTIASVAKDANNPHFDKTYATLAGHIEASRPHLKAQGLAVLQDVTTDLANEGVNITTRIVHKSGEWAEFGPLFVPASRWDAQGVGSGITYGRRYTYGAAVGTAPDDDDDGNAAVTGAPSRQKTEAQPAKVVDVATGAEVDVVATGLPEAPVGFYYVAGYKLAANGWHEASILRYDEQGGSLKVSTKTKSGETLKAAQDAGVPVRITTKERPGKVGEAYLDSCVMWKPTASQRAKLAPVPAPELPLPEGITSDDIPFVWAVPFLLPALLAVHSVLA